MAGPTTWAFRYRGWFGIVILVPPAVATFLSQPIIREESWLDVAGDVLAWLLFVYGGALRLWATLYVGGRKGRVVVCEGPYSLCRNPLYLGTFLLAASTGKSRKRLGGSSCRCLPNCWPTPASTATSIT